MNNNDESEEFEKDAISSESDLLHYDETVRQENKDRLQKIIDNMTPEELHRYEDFRRAGFNKNGIRKFVNNILGQSCNINFIISVSGIAKVFVGEMVEKALEIQKELNESGPLKPSHIHEAYRRLYKTMPHLKIQKENPYW
ncbi:transcription initiation factor TFIID subunit 11 [Binucleata daphniae]